MSSNILDEAISPLRRPRRPGHHHETLRDLGNDRDPSEDINQPERSNACPANYRISRARAVSATLISSDGASATVVPSESSKQQAKLKVRTQAARLAD
ncbi:hypothetical protein IVB57_32845 [Bradyrhizobium sp. CW9]|uniref:hypothetical protein n=1 Tax=Bradyrhizobium sp. CW9 TaxID=2782689 RepID=UPI001FF9F96C|nr:hypothetical protein [Bradyrhizobium sp. CW9]MCK1333014.1 hypothetical protein [Bradyrhizobium sp. CW9]